MLKNKRIRILSVCLALSMLFCTLVTSGAEIADSKTKEKIVTDLEEVIEISPEDKIDPALQEIMENSKATEKIPVSIWLTDIDQEAVDRTVERKTGLTRDNLEVVKENISDDLALEIMSLSEDSVIDKKVEKEFDDYMERTSKAHILYKQNNFRRILL
ncbi:MAG: hypothetical protein FWF94_05875 [Oscillospiraceae bacterium]|nr:hypothetical protein [Oscillospiraceae bacterium]